MPHFFIKSTDVNDRSASIKDNDTYRHIARSLRAKCGEKLLLIDENKIQYETIIEKITNSEIKVKIENSYPSKRELEFNLYLAQSPLRSDAQSTIIEKATELGVCGIYPILTDNCAVKEDIIKKKISKWQKIMFEASKQCERATIPTCYELSTFPSLIKTEKFDYIIAFCEKYANSTLKQFAETNAGLFNNSNILIIIGPEGGFSEKEFEIFRQNKIPMLTLGDLILKAETAVTVALGNIIYEYNNHRQN